MSRNGRTADGQGRPGAARPDGNFLVRLDGYLERRSSTFVVGVGLGAVLVIWGIDVATGPLLSPSLFYLVPVVLVAWRAGRVGGGVVAAASSVMWLGADLLGKLYAPESLAPYWNAIVRFGVLFVVAMLVAMLRSALQRQRDLAERASGAVEELRAMNDLKDTLLHAVSHDLRGPITAILGSVRTLQRGDQLQLTPEQRLSLLSAISISGHKLNRMVSDLLDLERLDRGVIEPEREPTDIRALARRMVEESDFLNAHPVRVEAGRVIVSVDVGKVERILENLLGNAAKHTPVGTPVLLKVQAEDDGVLLTVEDEGPGIPDELKATIFEPFRQGPAARSSGSGAGIGLSLVAKFAELHGGRAWVEDRPGGGTSFRVMLPGVIADDVPVALPQRRLPASGVAGISASSRCERGS